MVYLDYAFSEPILIIDFLAKIFLSMLFGAVTLTAMRLAIIVKGFIDKKSFDEIDKIIDKKAPENNNSPYGAIVFILSLAFFVFSMNPEKNKELLISGVLK